MKHMTDKQKTAILKILYDIVLADGYIDERELLYYKYVEKTLNVHEKELELAKQTNSLLALAEVNKLHPAQKEQFAVMMGKLIVADQIIHYNEVKIYNLVCDYCNINLDIEDSFDSDLLAKVTFVEPPLYPDESL